MPESMIKDRPEDPKWILPFAVYYAGRGRLGRAATGDGSAASSFSSPPDPCAARAACGVRRRSGRRRGRGPMPTPGLPIRASGSSRLADSCPGPSSPSRFLPIGARFVQFRAPIRDLGRVSGCRRRRRRGVLGDCVDGYARIRGEGREGYGGTLDCWPDSSISCCPRSIFLRSFRVQREPSTNLVSWCSKIDCYEVS